MQLFATVALLAWLPAVMLLFRDLRGHRALSVGYVAAWLFLPTLEIPMQGVPDYNKSFATTLGIALASLLFDTNLWLRFRPRIWDLSLLALVLAPIPSAVKNGLGSYHGFSMALLQFVTWAGPYFLGRLYFDSFDKMRFFARTIFYGGVVYVPFCLVEMRMSPQFSNWVYGIEQRVGMAVRYGGWRPSVFLDNGLELGMWMTASSLTAFALWYSGGMRLRKFVGIKETVCFGVLLMVTVLCKSTGALLLLIVSSGTLVMIRWRFRWAALVLTAVPILYISARTSDTKAAMGLVPIARSMFGEDRAQSLEFRFLNENVLVERALEQPVLGWGGWGRNLVFDEWGNVATIVDGLWIIVFGEYGFVALVSLYTALLATPTLACLRFGNMRRWKFDEVAPTLSLALFLLIYAVDCLLNAMENAVYPVALGALTTVVSIRDAGRLRKLENDEQFEAEVVNSPVIQRRIWPPMPDRKMPEPELPAKERPELAVEEGVSKAQEPVGVSLALGEISNSAAASPCQDPC